LFYCSNVLLFKCSIVLLFYCSNVLLFYCSMFSHSFVQSLSRSMLHSFTFIPSQSQQPVFGFNFLTLIHFKLINRILMHHSQFSDSMFLKSRTKKWRNRKREWKGIHVNQKTSRHIVQRSFG
jgi:hypothetical protein